MNCLQCGQQIPEQLPYCPICGSAVPGTAASEERRRENRDLGPEEPGAAQAEMNSTEALSSRSEEGPSRPTPVREEAQREALLPVTVPARSPTWRERLQPLTGRIGGGIAILGNILMAIAFFLPWFLVVIVMSVSLDSCGTATVTMMGEVGPSRPIPAEGTSLIGLPDWRTLFYLLLVIVSLLLSIIILLRPRARRRIWAAVAHLAVSFLQCGNFVALSSPPSNAMKFVITQILGGFWVGLTGLIIALIGSLQMLFESLLEPRQ
uniref:Zinc-ribbon domain-containing protein n=1 Tax=Thermogemmatispora argillosa TaxID=2045280 RepID=A0A455SUH2_9CHLR|nr:hypothetical protein KTA_02720 [Thermogemmatispora argillosa]